MSAAEVNENWPARVAELLGQLAQRQQGAERMRQAVGIIGPGDGQPHECAAAYRVAAALAGAGMAIICGGRGGVMQAASRGATDAGGVAIGILPEDDGRSANPYLTVVIPTGMGEMRNAVIARSALCLVAIGGGMGTISEMALGLKWGKPVFTLYADLQLPGAQATRDLEQLVEKVASALLQLP